MTAVESEIRRDLRGIVDNVFKSYPAEYWRELDRGDLYPEKFVASLTDTGLLGALVPEKYDGLGLSMADASVILEQINRNGGSSGAIHAQMYIMGTVLRHGSEEQKRKYLPGIAAGTIRLQSFAVTEPTTGSDTTQLKTTAVRDGDSYIVNGQKVWISRVQHTDLMLLLARTTPKDQVTKRSHGLSVFLIDLRELEGVTVTPIRSMVNHETNEVFFDDVRIPASSLVGEEGRGFGYIMDGMNAERLMVAAECIGDGRWFIEKVTRYTSERIVFDRPIGSNQGVQFPIARAHINIEAADLMRWSGCDKFDAGLDCGAEANMAKLLASEASWEAANCALQYHGGFGMAEEYDVERKFRETRLYQIAPISTNMILAYVGQHVLKMPRSY
jgi:acyl-CoA dehydrogenase